MSSEEKYDFEISFFEDLHQRLRSDTRVLSVLAELYTRVGQIDEGLKMDRKLVRLMPDDSLARYNLACSLALKGRKKDAVDSLRVAIDLGYRDFDWMSRDIDLNALRNYSGYIKLLEDLGLNTFQS